VVAQANEASNATDETPAKAMLLRALRLAFLYAGSQTCTELVEVKEFPMKQRRINATLTVVLALTSLLVLTPLPRASTATPRLERQPLESLTTLNSTEATERGAPLSAFSVPSAASVVQSPGTTSRVSTALRNAPVMFIENVGQFAEGARFQVRGDLGTMWLAEDAIWVTVLEKPSSPQPPSPNLGEGGAFLPSPKFGRGAGGEDQPCKGVNLRLTFPGANPYPRIEPFDRLDTVVSYFIGNDPAKWHPDVPVWGGVRYKDLYPDIDLEITSENSRMVQRLVAKPGADLNAVRLRVEGVDAIDLLPSPAASGRGAGGETLRLTTAVGEFTLPLLQAVTADGSPLPRAEKGPEVQANEVIAPFSSAPLLPSRSAQTAGASDLLYATFLGGSGDDDGYGIAVDPSGTAYVTGWTGSSDFPTTPGAFDTSYNGYDAFVVKLNAAGSALTYATFLGGGHDDAGKGIAVDSSGAAYVTGLTDSSDLPTTPGAFDTTYNGGRDAFVVKLNPAGSGLAYATFLGGSHWDVGLGIAVDGGGSAYVTGGTESSDLPTTPGAFDTTYNGYDDVFVSKLNPAGSALVYATFLGGSYSGEQGWGIAVDSSGAAYVTGWTGSSDFPTTPGAFDTTLNGGDAFVARLNPAGSGLAYATFLGGSYSGEQGWGIAVDPSGAAYVTGETWSSDFPTTPGAFDTSFNGRGDAFVVKLNAAGSALTYATFLGGGHDDEGEGIAVDSSGAAYVTGWTSSSDFPTTPGAFDTSFNGDYDAFVVKLNAAGSALTYATFLGGSGFDEGYGIAVDSSGAAYVTGYTESSDFPTTPGAFDTSHNGHEDAFVAKLGMGGGAGLSISHIEVTQATQTITNSVPLIAGKPTFVRVYVDCGEGCTALPNVTGVLRGYSLGEELPGSPLSPSGFPGTQTIRAEHMDWRDQRGNLEKTLKFRLPTDWLSGTIRLAATVFVGSPGQGESSSSTTVSFQTAQTLRIALVPIRYEQPLYCLVGEGGEPTDRIWTAFDWAQRVYPTARIEIVRLPPMPFKEPLCWPWRDLFGTDKYLFNELWRWNQLAGNRATYVFGWLPDGAHVGGNSRIYEDKNTKRTLRGDVAFGDDDPDEGQLIFAHEVAHLLKRPHTKAGTSGSCENETPDRWSDWPEWYGNAKIQEWGLDGYGFGWLVSSPSAVKNPNDNYDYTSYCWGKEFANRPAWTSPWTYEHIYSETLKLQTTALAAQSLSTPQPYFIASGLVYTDSTATLDPIWVITSTTVPENPPEGTEYCLEAQNASGTPLVSRCLDLTFVNYGTGEATNVDGFNLMLPYPSGVARIVLKKESQELAVRPVSANEPVVAVLFPNGGESWAASGTYTITWTASDADSDPLTYSVLYSPDGTDWVPVGTAITETQLAVNAAELAGSTNARIRVLASDGVNTSADESDAPFTVGRKPPQAFIISPEADSATLEGTPVWLEGFAYDLEDGTLGDASLGWASSRDGDLGTGAQVLTTLSLGQHILTLTATDSNGNVGTATVQVLVTFPEDIVPDCQVDVADIMQVASRWRCKCEDACYEPRYDLDGDCDVDIVDIMLVVKHWGETCE